MKDAGTGRGKGRGSRPQGAIRRPADGRPEVGATLVVARLDIGSGFPLSRGSRYSRRAPSFPFLRGSRYSRRARPRWSFPRSSCRRRRGGIQFYVASQWAGHPQGVPLQKDVKKLRNELKVLVQTNDLTCFRMQNELKTNSVWYAKSAEKRVPSVRFRVSGDRVLTLRSALRVNAISARNTRCQASGVR